VSNSPDLPGPGASPAELHRWQAEARERRAAALDTWVARNRRIWRDGLLKIILIEWAAVLLMLWSFHTTSSTAGYLAFWGALGLGDGGFLVVFVRTWRAAEAG
jgi:hypothetical protein